jgi:hypothetical protein
MLRTRISLCCIVVLLFLRTSAPAQNHFLGSGFTFVPPPVAPANVWWRLATQGGQFVELVVPPATYSTRQIVHLVTPENAADYGLDFAAWSAAVNDPSYNRSIVMFGGVTKEAAWSNHWGFPFEVERIQLFVNDYTGPTGSPAVEVAVVDFIPVPEPATIWLAMFCGLVRVRRL